MIQQNTETQLSKPYRITKKTAPHESPFRAAPLKAPECLPEKSGLSESSGKLILCGEHGVMFGAKALAMPISGMTMGLCIERSSSQKSHITVNGGVLTQELLPTLLQALKLLGLEELAPLKVTVNTQIPLGAGLGASAALSVNIIRALGHMNHLNLSAEQVMEYAHHLEKRFHGTPSGIDVHVITQGRLISFQKEQGARPINPPRRFKLALIDSGVRSSTKMMVSRSSKFFAEEDQRKHLVEAFNTCHHHTLQALTTGSYEDLGAALNEAADLLKQISVTGSVLEEAMENLRSLGIQGVKPTGSGGAGFLLALLPSEEQKMLENIQNTMSPPSITLVEL